MRNGLLSVDARACSLAHLLPLIGAAADISFTVSEAVPPQAVTRRIDPQPVATAIRELLRDADVFVLYAAQEQGPSRPVAVWVYPRGAAKDIVPVPAASWASTRDLEHQFSDRDPALRAVAVEELIARTGAAALPRVLDALADGDARLRERALDAALGAGVEVPIDRLESLALYDTSPQVRLRALQSLEGRPESRPAIEAATADADADISREARDMLQRLGGTSR